MLRPPLQADDIDKSMPFKRWHRTLESNYYACDIDFIEYRMRGGELVPVAVFELTTYTGGNDQPIPESYKDSIIERYETGIQKRSATLVAKALNTRAYIVLFRPDLSEFWLYCLTTNKGWRMKSKLGMEQFIGAL